MTTITDKLAKLERAQHRMGELWATFQGKGWPEPEGAEFNRLRDDVAPALRAELLAAHASQQAEPEAQQAEPSGGSVAAAASTLRNLFGCSAPTLTDAQWRSAAYAVLRNAQFFDAVLPAATGSEQKEGNKEAAQ